MKPDDLSELRELVDFLKENQIAEFDLDRGELKVRIKFAPPSSPGQMDPASLLHSLHAAAAVAPVPALAQGGLTQKSDEPPASATEAEDATGHTIKSPIVGTFYESSSPGSAPFVKIGDAVEAGQVVCIIEAMKLMNEIEADASGEIIKRLVTNGQPVEYGQALFLIRPRS